MDCKFGSMWGGWFLVRIMGRVGLVYAIYRRWVGFSRYIRFELGDGSKIRFWRTSSVGSRPLKLVFLELFSLARFKDASAVDHL